MSYLYAVGELYAKDKCIGVSEYTCVGGLPDNLKGSIPGVQEVEIDLLRMQNQKGDAV